MGKCSNFDLIVTQDNLPVIPSLKVFRMITAENMHGYNKS